MSHLPKAHIALPSDSAIGVAIADAQRSGNDGLPRGFDTTSAIEEADVVISDRATISDESFQLPQSVRYLQLIDCGSGYPYSGSNTTIVANASPFLSKRAAHRAVNALSVSDAISSPKVELSDLDVGIVGFGMLGREIARRLNDLGATIKVQDIRTPQQGALQAVGARRFTLDMMLSTSDAVFIAVHHGPTADPLLSERELKLMAPQSSIINLSPNEVVDTDAIDRLNADLWETGNEIDAIRYRRLSPVSERDLTAEDSVSIAGWVLDNVGKWARGHRPESIVEPVDFPVIGDPAFWSSRMSPRQDSMS